MNFDDTFQENNRKKILQVTYQYESHVLFHNMLFWVEFFKWYW